MKKRRNRDLPRPYLYSTLYAQRGGRLREEGLEKERVCKGRMPDDVSHQSTEFQTWGKRKKIEEKGGGERKARSRDAPTRMKIMKKKGKRK